jgi:hypothetical protein
MASLLSSSVVSALVEHFVVICVAVSASLVALVGSENPIQSVVSSPPQGWQPIPLGYSV